MKVLDCTLRDGGYVNNWQFTEKQILDVVKSIDLSGIDYIEVGFRDSKSDYLLRRCSESFLEEIRQYIGNTQICVMIDYGKAEAKDFNQPSFIDMLRIAVHKDKAIESLSLCQELKKKGFKISLQMMGFATYSTNELDEFLRQINKENEPEYLYIADSYGSFLPKELLYQVGEFKKYLKKYNIKSKIGFHPHNNLQLAFANSMLLMQLKYLDIVDSTLFGMGRGAGNLPTELLLFYLNKNGSKYNLTPILECIKNTILPLRRQHEWGYSIPNALTGNYGLHPYYSRNIKEENIEDQLSILERLTSKHPIGYKAELIKQLIDNRKKYIEFVAELSLKYSKVFGNNWWYSLLHEKNPSKSDLYHCVAKEKDKKYSFAIAKSLYRAARKILAILFYKLRYTKKRSYLKDKNLLVGYYTDSIQQFKKGLDAQRVFLPQRSEIGNDFDEDFITYDFFNITDLFRLFFRYVNVVSIFDSIYGELKKDIEKKYKFQNFKEEVFRSFLGGICIEGIFYEIVFSNIKKKLNPEKIFYIYEGHAWEKALNAVFNDTKTIGIIQAAMCHNLLNYYYSKKEVEVMPKPDRLLVMGEFGKKVMSEVYGEDKVFVLGTTRHGYLKDKLSQDRNLGEYNLVVLGGADEDANEELLEFVSLANVDFVVRKHPLNKRSYSKWEDKISEIPMYKLVGSARTIIVNVSAVAIEAIALGIPVIIPQLPSFVDVSPLASQRDFASFPETTEELRNYLNYPKKVEYKKRKEFIEDYFSFVKFEEQLKILQGL